MGDRSAWPASPRSPAIVGSRAFESGAHRRLKTIARTSASASKLRREERSARLIAGPKPRLFATVHAGRMGVTEGASTVVLNRLALFVLPSARFRPSMSGSSFFGSS